MAEVNEYVRKLQKAEQAYEWEIRKGLGGDPKLQTVALQPP